MIADFYLCPVDRQSLSVQGSTLVCTSCHRKFETTEGVLDFDVIKSSQREAFDAKFKSQQGLTAEEIAASTKMASEFLVHAGGVLEDKKIVDIGCGNGALTYGLLSNPSVSNCDIFCFDHSVGSMRIFLNSAAEIQTTNRLLPSIQDVHRFAYPDNFFDVVFGCAILHHFLEYEKVLAQVYQSLKKGGVAVFAEPFAHGYLWVMFLLKLAGETIPANAPDMGEFKHITKDSFFRLDHYADKNLLADFIDKFFFLEDELTNLCGELGFSVRFAPFSPKEYYDVFMLDMLRTYGISNPKVVAKAKALYESLHDSIPQSLHRLVAHFKYIILLKPL